MGSQQGSTPKVKVVEIYHKADGTVETRQSYQPYHGSKYNDYQYKPGNGRQGLKPSCNQGYQFKETGKSQQGKPFREKSTHLQQKPYQQVEKRPIGQQFFPIQNQTKISDVMGKDYHEQRKRSPGKRIEPSQESSYSRQERDLADYEKGLLAKTQELEKNLEKANEIGKKMKDPKKYKELKAEHMENFIKGIKKMDFSSATQTKFKNRAVLGTISTGKSSLLNTIMGSTLEVGHGETTLEPTRVHFSDELYIWDTPGENDEYNITKIETLSALCQCDRIFVLYESSLKKVDTMVKVVNAAKPGCGFLIRTKCDMFNKNMNKTMEQELAEDQKVLRSWGINPEAMPIYCTSAISRDAFDNQIVHRLFTTNSREPSQYKPNFSLQKQKESQMVEESNTKGDKRVQEPKMETGNIVEDPNMETEKTIEKPKESVTKKTLQSLNLHQ